jgi:heptaprenyl diphosphate synthase
MQQLLIQTDEKDHHIAKMAAIAIALHVVESVIPSPLPGVKPGIANIVTLYIFSQYGFKSAAWVSLLRVFASSLILGQFLTPSFLLSLTGAIASLGMLWLLQKLPSQFFGAISLSIFCAFAHIAGQFIVVRAWLIPHDGIYYLLPIFALSALFFGILNGFIMAKILNT